MFLYSIETAGNKVQDTSYRWSGGFSPALKVPQYWGNRGLIESISAVS
jgi:hypothetical protein